ncbi:flagellar motor switch protein FliN/FliY [Jezberella montanilacus]|jgi:flagellar motor switch protein FliN/FliY|uniref:Flagellar motor switch protein FliN n=1 Tax=Jezberella montanilacus TaxID=323426 RepID=A0A2T0XD90_9BURK|nr:flagellar motor switch protein FliN [Jezberella montanilacus]PRY96914.1 flagellar motor switch protein FliN/FliY [Jezberella montanilacus]
MATTPEDESVSPEEMLDSGWDDAMREQSEAAVPAAARTDVFDEFAPAAKQTGQNDIEFILDIPIQLTVELGRTKMTIKNLLQLGQGSIVELNGMAGEPMDVMVNGYIVAQGEVVVVNDKFGIRLTDIITPTERIRKLNR